MQKLKAAAEAASTARADGPQPPAQGTDSATSSLSRLGDTINPQLQAANGVPAAGPDAGLLQAALQMQSAQQNPLTAGLSSQSHMASLASQLGEGPMASLAAAAAAPGGGGTSSMLLSSHDPVVVPSKGRGLGARGGSGLNLAGSVLEQVSRGAGRDAGRYGCDWGPLMRPHLWCDGYLAVPIAWRPDTAFSSSYLCASVRPAIRALIEEPNVRQGWPCTK